MTSVHQLVVTVPRDDVELASDLLWGWGVVAIEERSAGDGGAVELWTSLGDEAIDGSANGDGSAVDPVLLQSIPWPWRLVEVDLAVAETWRQFATEIRVSDDLVVRPEWVVGESHPSGTTVVVVEPGSTFGMGDHPTTIGCLRAVRRHVRSGDTVLDVGCGSGVLAVLAAMQGARCTAIDIAPASVPTTRHNAAINGIEVDVSTTLLSDVEGDFDVVLANILAPVLVGLADDLVRVVRPGGLLVISGILSEPARHAHVLAALSALTVVETADVDGWATITLRR